MVLFEIPSNGTSAILRTGNTEKKRVLKSFNFHYLYPINKHAFQMIRYGFALLLLLFQTTVCGQSSAHDTVLERIRKIKHPHEKASELKRQTELVWRTGNYDAGLKYGQLGLEIARNSHLKNQEHLPDYFILYEPKDIVAGDFYWLEVFNGWTIFAAADCTGHGVPGAMMSVVCHNALNRSVKEFHLVKPGEILDKTRQLIVDELSKNKQEVADGMDISLCAWHKESNQVLWAGANNSLWILRKGGLEIEEIKANKQPIGKHTHYQPFETHAVSLSNGDSIYLYTDGYADQFGGSTAKKFKSKNLKLLLTTTASEPLNRQLSILKNTFEDWKGKLEQVDDVCILCIEM